MTEETFEQLGKEYQKELQAAVNEAKAHQLGSPVNYPLWENGRVIALFREYWLKCDSYNKKGDLYYNPKWLTHRDLSGELWDIIDAMPYYPIGIDKNGRYC